MTQETISEEQMVYAVRNALIIAGREMAEDGDHWPVIKSTVHAVMKDWENLKVERNVHEELKLQLGVILEKMEAELPNCPANVRTQVAQKLKEMQELYEAYFSEVDRKAFDVDNMEMPAHVKRAEVIIDSLEDDDA